MFRACLYAPANFSSFLERIAGRHVTLADAGLPADLDKPQIGLATDTIARVIDPEQAAP